MNGVAFFKECVWYFSAKYITSQSWCCGLRQPFPNLIYLIGRVSARLEWYWLLTLKDPCHWPERLGSSSIYVTRVIFMVRGIECNYLVKQINIGDSESNRPMRGIQSHALKSRALSSQRPCLGLAKGAPRWWCVLVQGWPPLKLMFSFFVML